MLLNFKSTWEILVIKGIMLIAYIYVIDKMFKFKSPKKDQV